MKKIIGVLLLLSFLSCNDGDFDVPAFEFTETIGDCGGVLYILSQDKTEALILTIDESRFDENVGEESYLLSGTIKLTYRIFSDGLGNDYFCNDIPPSEPDVLKELVAYEGSVVIVTNEEVDSNGNITGYNYDISFSEIMFEDGNERIFFESFQFGNYVK